MSFFEDHRSLRSMLGHCYNHNSLLSAALLHDLSQQKRAAQQQEQQRQDDGQIESSQQEGDHDGDEMDLLFPTFGPSFSSRNEHSYRGLLSFGDEEAEDDLLSSLPLPTTMTTSTTNGKEEAQETNCMISAETSSQHGSTQASRKRMTDILQAVLGFIEDDDDDEGSIGGISSAILSTSLGKHTGDNRQEDDKPMVMTMTDHQRCIRRRLSDDGDHH